MTELTLAGLTTGVAELLSRTNLLLQGRVLIATLDFDTATTPAGLAAGKFRLNAGSAAAATQVWCSTSDSVGADIAALLQSYDDSTSAVRGLLRLRSLDDGARFRVYRVVGPVTSDSGYVAVPVVHVAGGGGEFSAGERVAQDFSPAGDAGAGYAGTSTSPLTVALGALTITTQIGLAYQPGTRVRIARTSAPTTTWLEGVVTAYTPTSPNLAVLVDRVLGSGTWSDWTLSVAGQGALDAAAADAAAATAVAARDQTLIYRDAADAAADTAQAAASAADADRVAAEGASLAAGAARDQTLTYRDAAVSAAAAAAQDADDADAARVAAQAAASEADADRVAAEAAASAAVAAQGQALTHRDAAAASASAAAQDAADADAARVAAELARDQAQAIAGGDFLTPAANLADVQSASAARANLGLGSAAVQEATAFAPAAHAHAIADVTGLQTALDGKAAAAHTHAISDVTGLQAELTALAAAAGAAQSSATAAAAIGRATLRTAAFNVSPNGGIDAIDTSGGAITATLPANPAPGDVVRFADARRTWANNNVTVARNGRPINGAALDLILNVSGRLVTLIYRDDTYGWSVQV